jgi:hypothetical protein
MPELSEIDKLPTLAAPSGNDLIPVSDASVNGPYGPKVAGVRLNQLVGLNPADVTVDADGGTVTANRLTFISGGSTSTVNVPAASGELREVIVMNGGSGNATVTSATANIRTAAVPTASTTSVVSAGATGRFHSDGTTWYRA